jgi:hypothetical protein
MFCKFISKHNSSLWEECEYIILPRALAKNNKHAAGHFYNIYLKKCP